MSFVLDRVLGPLCLARHPLGLFCFFVALEVAHEAKVLEGRHSAQKALQGSDTEMSKLMGGMEDNIVFH